MRRLIGSSSVAHPYETPFYKLYKVYKVETFYKSSTTSGTDNLAWRMYKTIGRTVTRVFYTRAVPTQGMSRLSHEVPPKDQKRSNATGWDTHLDDRIGNSLCELDAFKR